MAKRASRHNVEAATPPPFPPHTAVSLASSSLDRRMFIAPDHRHIVLRSMEAGKLA